MGLCNFRMREQSAVPRLLALIQVALPAFKLNLKKKIGKSTRWPLTINAVGIQCVSGRLALSAFPPGRHRQGCRCFQRQEACPWRVLGGGVEAVVNLLGVRGQTVAGPLSTSELTPSPPSWI